MGKRNPNALPEGQREIMDVIWDRGEASAFEVREILAQKREISRTAVRTSLERLERKGWLKHRVVGRTHFYSPLVSRDMNLKQRVVELVDRACGGKPERLMAALLEQRGLSDVEVKRIEALLEAARQQNRTPGRKLT
jgi:predicted transcriptional regulator